MDIQKIDLYLTTNAKYFEPSAMPIIRQKLENASDDVLASLQATELKDPSITLLFSIFFGSLGVDRFVIGDTKRGLLKLSLTIANAVLTAITFIYTFSTVLRIQW